MTGLNQPVSAVICAYTEDRWDDLVAAVQSMKQQTHAPGEIIVVIDHNPGLLERLRAFDSTLCVVANVNSKGLSGARNTGITISCCPLIAFLDDDAIAGPDWLERLATLCSQSAVLGVGGWVDPLWTGTRPSWFPDEFLWVLGCSYTGQPQQVAAVRNPFGGCMCIRREVFEIAGGFRQDLGKNGKQPIGCEETELCIRAQQILKGSIFLFDPSARIGHSIPANRATWRYFCSRCLGEGWSKAMISHMIGARDGLSSERAYTTKVLPLGIARGFKNALINQDVTGLLRSFAIALGFSCTVAGYVKGRLALLGQRFLQGNSPAKLETSST